MAQLSLSFFFFKQFMPPTFFKISLFIPFLSSQSLSDNFFCLLRLILSFPLWVSVRQD